MWTADYGRLTAVIRLLLTPLWLIWLLTPPGSDSHWHCHATSACLLYSLLAIIFWLSTDCAHVGQNEASKHCHATSARLLYSLLGIFFGCLQIAHTLVKAKPQNGELKGPSPLFFFPSRRLLTPRSRGQILLYDARWIRYDLQTLSTGTIVCWCSLLAGSGEAVDENGKLKDAKDIVWYHDKDDAVPIASGSNPPRMF
jgi:hypothetical protein